MIEALADLRRLVEQEGPDRDWWRWALVEVAVEISDCSRLAIENDTPPILWGNAIAAIYRRRHELAVDLRSDDFAEERILTEINRSLNRLEELCNPNPEEERFLMAPTATKNAPKTKPAKAKPAPKPSLKKAAEKSGIGFYGDPAEFIESLAPAEVVTVEKISASEIDTETIICGIDQIRPSPDNPRQTFTPDFLQRLGKSIEENGQLAPLLVLPRGADWMYEIIDGETRWRAATAVGLQHLECRVVNCSPAEAAALRLITANERNPLNAIEEARGLQILMTKHGWSQRVVEAKIGMSQGQVSNRTRLLNLPQDWQERVISGEISPTQARELAPWVDFPQVLTELAARMKDNPKYVRGNWSSSIINAADRLSRPLSGSFYGYLPIYGYQLAFKWEKHKEELRVVKVDGSNRAFNIELWEQLQSEGVRAKRAREAGKAEKIQGDPQLSAAEQKERKKKLAEQFAKKLWRFKCAWMQQRIVERIPKLPDAQIVQLLLLFAVNSRAGNRDSVYDEARGHKKRTESWMRGSISQAERARDVFSMQLEGSLVVARLCLAKILQGPFESHESDTPSELIQEVADWLGVDPRNEWKNSEEFLQLHTSDQLRELAAEWKMKSNGLTSPDKMKRGDLVAWLKIDGANAKCPKEFIEQKAVRF